MTKRQKLKYLESETNFLDELKIIFKIIYKKALRLLKLVSDPRVRLQAMYTDLFTLNMRFYLINIFLIGYEST